MSDPRTEPTDDQLFRRFRDSADPEALALLFDRSAPALMRLALRLAGNLPDAEDLVQETFLAAIDARHRYRRGNLRAWLVAILERRVRRLHRTRRRQPPSSAAPPRTTAPSASESAARREELDILRQRVADLEEPYASVLRLKLQHGFTAREIGIVLDRPVDTVQSQLRRGLERLRERLPLAAIAFDGLPPRGLRERILAAARRPRAPVPPAVGSAFVLRSGGVLLVLVAAAAAWRAAAPRGVEAPPTFGFELRASSPRSDASPGAPPAPRRAIAEAVASPDSEALAPEDAVRLKVVDRLSGQPVPGAIVRFPRPGVDMRDVIADFDDYQEFYVAAFGDPEPEYERYGDHVVTDATGEATIPWIASLSGVTVRKGDLYGARWDDRSKVILIEPDRTLEIRVRDATGRPVVGLEVTVGIPDEPYHTVPGCRRVARTDVDGVARFRHAQDLLHALQAHGRNQAEIALRAPLPDDVRVPDLPLDHWPMTPVDIDVPPLATLVIERCDAEGRPLSMKSRAFDSAHVRVPGRSEPFPVAVAGTATTLHFVPSGGAIELLSAAGDRCHVPPLRAGEVRTVRLRVGCGGVMIRGRILGVDGAPLASAAFRFESPSDGDVGYTDASGQFAVLTTETVSRPARIRRRATWRYRCGIERESEETADVATLNLPSSAPGTVVDVGDVALRRLEPLVEGRLVTHPEGFEDGILDRRPLQLEVLGPNGAFEPVYDDIVEMEPDGRFRMTMLEPTSSALRMTVCSGLVGPELRALPQPPIPITASRSDLLVTLEIGGSLTLAVTDPALEDLRVELSPSPGDWPAWDTRDLRAWTPVPRGPRWSAERPHQRFALRDALWPGRYRVVVRRADDPAPIAAFDGVEVRAGQVTTLWIER